MMNRFNLAFYVYMNIDQSTYTEHKVTDRIFILGECFKAHFESMILFGIY